MRRKDRQRDAQFALDVIRDCEYATLATVNEDGTPYCIPISPVLLEGDIYFHCAPEGKKLDNIARCPAVCVSAVRHTKLVPERFTSEFESALATGRCELLENENEKVKVLRGICEKYAASHMEAFEQALANSLFRTAICKITIETITGKAKIIKNKEN